MPLPPLLLLLLPKPLEPPLPLLPELEEDPELETLPRAPAEVDPALRLAALDELAGAELMLLPAELVLTSPATDAALLVAALTRAVASAADLLVAATPPPVPEAWPETAERDACRAVLREAAWAAAAVDGPLLLGGGGAE
jgi:hypothetical protein